MSETTVHGSSDALVTLVDGFVPVIDLAVTRTGDGVRRAHAARTIGRVCESSGFFVVVNHEVPAATIDRARQATAQLFAWPAGRKAALAVDPADPLTRGYGRETEPAILREQGPDGNVLETFVINHAGEPLPPGQRSATAGAAWYRPNRWPELTGFREAYLEYFAAAERLAMEIMQLFALALGLPHDWFEDKFTGHLTSMAANRYAGRSTRPRDGELRKGEHTDWGTLTVLYKDQSARGLQVFDRDGNWVEVPSIPDSFVINIGDLMARWTNDRWASTVHRVVHLGDGTGYAERHSLAFFHQPGYDTLIECIPGCADERRPARHAPITFGDYLTGKLRRAYLHRRIAAGPRA